MNAGPRLRQAAAAVIRATDAHRDALNGLGHEGVPHDRYLAQPPVNGFEIRDLVGDCAACGGAQYGTEDDLQGAVADLRAALGEERKPWEWSRP